MNSSTWKNSALFLVYDEGGGFFDHVAPPRVDAYGLGFRVPSLASVNHQFDTSTPGANNDAANGQAVGPPAPPRDGLPHIGDFSEAFDFSQDPNYHPSLPFL